MRYIEIICPQCEGEGEISTTRRDYCLGFRYNTSETYVWCPMCDGDGVIEVEATD